MRLVLLDWSLIDLTGHAYEYDRNVLGIFNEMGWHTALYTHKKCIVSNVGGTGIRRCFSYAPTETIVTWRMLRPIAKLFCHWLITGAEARAAVRKEDSDDTIFFVQHAEPYQLPALARAFLGSRGRLLLMLRTTSLQGNPQRPTFRSWLYKLFLLGLAFVLRERLILCTDSNRLKAEYERLVNLPIHVVPIPNPERVPPKSRAHGDPVRVLMAGRTSYEKGIRYLPDLIRSARASRLPISFEIHTYDHSSETGKYDGWRRELESLIAKDVVLVSEPLSTEEYWKHARAADVSLLLYDTERYRNQTSNLVLDAFACGTFPIVSADTWLSDIIEITGFGIAVSLDDHKSVVDKTIAILSKQLPSEVPDKVKRVLLYHCAANFYLEVGRLLNISAAVSQHHSNQVL